MKYLHQIAAIPNALINDTVVHYTTKKVAVAMLFMTTRKTRTVTATVQDIAQAAACSTATVQQAIRELVQEGYLVKEKLYRYSEGLKRVVFAASRYQWTKPQGGYTLVKRDILGYGLTPSAFCVLLFLYRCAGRRGRAFPSLRHMAGLLKDMKKKGMDMAKATVCRAVCALRGAVAVIRYLCSTLAGDYANSSYLLTDMVMPKSSPAQAPSREGVVSNLTSIYDINQITKDYNLGKKKYGVAEFVGLHKNPGSDCTGRLWNDFEYPYRFDDTGIFVSVSGALSELM